MMPNALFGTSFAVVLAAMPLGAYADSAPAAPAPSASPLATIGTVSTAERSTAPLSSTVQTVYTISKAQIEARGYQTIADAIRNLPGVTLFQYGAFGSQASYGTLGSSRSIVLLNGNPILEGSDGSSDLGKLSATGVERIEIVESGGSTLYGSGGAGGVINIITSVPRDEYLDVSYGSYGDRAVRAEVGNGTIGATFERHIANNEFPYPAQNGLPAGYRQNAQALQTAASLEYGQSFGDWNVRATARLSKIDLGVPGPVQQYDGTSELTPAAFDPENRNDLDAKLTRTSGKFTSSLSLSGFHQALFDNNAGAGPLDAVVDARTNLDFEEIVRESNRDRLVAGADLSRESLLDILGASGPPDEFAVAQSQTALYAQQAFGIGPDGKFYIGARAENDTPAGNTLQPAAGLQFPIGRLRIAANAASSFIVPTLFDLYYPNFSNPNLLPERDRNLDLILSVPQHVLNPRITFFDRTAANLITNDANFTPVNAGLAHFAGFIVSVSPQVGPFQLQASLTALPTATQVAGGITRRVDYEPIVQGTFSIDRVFGRSNVAYGLSAKSTGPHTESFSGPGTYGQYTTFDAYVRAKLSHDAVLTARVDDFGNRLYETYNAYPMPGRTYRIELSTR